MKRYPIISFNNVVIFFSAKFGNHDEPCMICKHIYMKNTPKHLTFWVTPQKKYTDLEHLGDLIPRIFIFRGTIHLKSWPGV